jgi:predicted AlkP superfamily phosphohydrolase/phosphomutase
MSYATGRDPGELGVYDWQGIDVDARESVQHSPSTFHGVGFWEADVPALSVNLPGAPAVAREDTISVPGPGGSLSDLPNDVVSHLPDEYDVTPGRMEVDEAIDQMRAKFDAFSRLVEKMDHPPIAHLTVFAIDGVMHYNWDDDEALGRAFEAIDQGIASIVESTDAGYDVVVMSDHGMQRLHYLVDINYWLRENGYLELSHSNVNTSNRIITKNRLRNVVTSVGISTQHIKSLAPDSMLNYIRSRVPADDRDYIGDNLKLIEFDKSTAFAFGNQVFLLNKGMKDKLQQDMRTMETPDGNRLLRDVHSSNNLYSSLRPPQPDLVVEPEPGYLPRRAFSDQFLTTPEGDDLWSACHQPEGVVIAPDEAVCSMSITDLMPRIMNMIGVEMPAEKEKSAVESDSNELEDHLQSLGYLE